MMAKTNNAKIGAYAFILAIVIAIIAGLAVAATLSTTGAPTLSRDTTTGITIVLVILGAIVGFLNVTSKELANFLLAAIGLLLVGVSSAVFAVIPVIGPYIAWIINYIGVMVAPAVVVVALKEIWNIGATPL